MVRLFSFIGGDMSLKTDMFDFAEHEQPCDKNDLQKLVTGAEQWKEVYSDLPQKISISESWKVPYTDYSVDLAIKIDNDNYSLGRDRFQMGTYLFDFVEGGPELRSNEFLTLVRDTCFENVDGDLTLKPQYKYYPFLCSKIPHHEVFLSPRLLNAIKKIDLLEKMGYKYALLGVDAMETVSDRIENKIVSGRCDRLYSAYGASGPCEEASALTIMTDYGIKLSTKRVYFPGKIIIQPDGTERKIMGTWKRAIID
jgi:hypothetical protein